MSATISGTDQFTMRPSPFAPAWCMSCVCERRSTYGLGAGSWR